MISIVTWEEILLAEEKGRKGGSSTPIKTLERSQPEIPVAPRTIFVDHDSRKIDNYEAVIDTRGAGTVHNLNIKSASSAFGISIQIDENNEFRRSYSNLNSDSDELCDMSAYPNGGYYIIAVSDLKFRDKIKVGIYNTEGGSLTYEKIQGKYEVVK